MKTYILFNLVCYVGSVVLWPWLGWFALVLWFLPELIGLAIAHRELGDAKQAWRAVQVRNFWIIWLRAVNAKPVHPALEDRRHG